MRLSTYVEKEWKEMYTVHESKFYPGGILTPATLVVVASQEGEHSKILNIPYQSVRVTYEERRKQAELTLHKRIVSGKRMDAFSSRDYTQTELVNADFEVPEGFKLIGLEEKVKE